MPDSPTQCKPCLIDFDVLQEYIIPRKGFFNRYIAVNDSDSKYSILGFPVAIANPKYQRNEFIFNFGLVVEGDDGDQIPYERVVRRLAVTFAEMEKQDEYLSKDGMESEAGRRPIESLLEIIKEDLNNYGECMIPVGERPPPLPNKNNKKNTNQIITLPLPILTSFIDDANTINMKLFPHHRTPPQVNGWHVPVAKMKCADVVDPTWDLTLQKVIRHIDGVSDVRRIAFAADVSLDLTKLALRHLLYYDTILLLDMFFFGSCYAPRPGIHDFIANVGANDGYAGGGDDGGGEALGAAALGGAGGRNIGGNVGGGGGGGGSGGGGGGVGIVDECANYVCIMSSGERVSNYQLIKLLTSFCVGRTVAEWLRLHMDAGFDVLRYVDVRRLVQFGVIKGLLYRVHKHVVSKQYIAGLVTGQSRVKEGGDALQRYMDGAHCFDQIITEMNLTEAGIMERLKGFSAPAGDLTVLYR